jgi:ribosomal protein S18 acetylase RimI-like enzyme
MISIVKATPSHVQTILTIGKISVEEAHRSSCDATVLGQYIEKNYNTHSIQEELKDDKNIYHILYVDDKPAGFSKIILNVAHPNILQKNSTKLDRIYLLSEFFDRKLGLELLQFNINLAKNNNQSGMWLFTWVGNTRAINFYLKHGFQIIGSHNFQVTETHYNLNHQMLLTFH